MTLAITPDQWQQVLAYPFRDPKWGNKLLLGSAVILTGSIVPVVPWLLVMGYFCPAPAAGDRRRTVAPARVGRVGAVFTDGLKLFGVSLVYSLPAIMLMVVASGLWLAPSFMLFLAPTVDESQVGMWVAGMFGAMALGWVVMGLAMLLMFIALLFQPPAMAHMVAKGPFGAAFRVREWWRILRANWAGFALAYVIVMGLAMVAYSAKMVLYVTLVLCFLLPFVLAPLEVYLVMIAGAVFGEAYRTG